MRTIFCDMDGVLVHQTGRSRFDLMPWRADGRELWGFIAPLRTVILSQLRADIYEQCRPEKLSWCERELGPDVPVIVVRAEHGKAQHSSAGAVLIDDSSRHRAGWESRGGIFVHHRSSIETIEALRRLI